MITRIPASRQVRQRIRHLGPGRILQADEPGEDEILFQAVALDSGAQDTIGKREDAQPLLGHCLLGRDNLLAQRAVESDGCRRPAESGCTGAARIRARPCSTACGPPASRARSTAACDRRRRESRPAADRRTARPRRARPYRPARSPWDRPGRTCCPAAPFLSGHGTARRSGRSRGMTPPAAGLVRSRPANTARPPGNSVFTVMRF